MSPLVQLYTAVVPGSRKRRDLAVRCWSSSDDVVDAGLSGLLVDHDTRLMFDVCDRIYILDFGSVVAAGLPATTLPIKGGTGGW